MYTHVVHLKRQYMQAKTVTVKVIIPLKAFSPFWALEGLIVFGVFSGHRIEKGKALPLN